MEPVRAPPSGATKRTRSREILGGLFEGAFDKGEAALGLFAEEFFLFGAFAQAAVQLVGDGQGGEDRGFLGVHGPGGVGDGAHFFIDIGGEFLDVGGIEIASDGIGLAEDLDSGGHLVLALRPEGKIAQNGEAGVGEAQEPGGGPAIGAARLI